GEAPRGGDLALQALDVGVEEFLDPAAAQADQVVVVVPLVEFEHRLAGLEVAALEQACLLELGQDPVDRRQADLVVLGEQFLEDVLGTHVALAAGMEDFENLQARQRRLQPCALELGGVGHGRGHHRPVAWSAREAEPCWSGAKVRSRTDGACTGTLIIMAFAAQPPYIDIAMPDTRSKARRPAAPRATRAASGLALALAIAGASLLGACASRDSSRSGFFEPHRIDLPQGNYITGEMLDKVKPGMSP